MKHPIICITLIICFYFAICPILPSHAATSQKILQNQPAYQYLLSLPTDYDQKPQKWPLILFLHGAGERGDNLELVKTHGPPKIVDQNINFPFSVVSPQCPARGRWSNELLIDLLDNIIKKYDVDTDRIYLTGISMGGYGAWSLATEHPDRFAAISPICGGGDPQNAPKLKNTPIWAFHGAQDPVVPVQRTEEMARAVQLAGGNIRVTIYPDATHDSWTAPYDSQGLYDWFLSHKKNQSSKPSTPGSYSQSFTAVLDQTPLPYLLTIPQNYDPKGEYSPLILFLHGAGERGADLDRVKIHSPLNFANDNPDDFPFILVSPQCATNHTWLNELKDLAALLDDITSRYNVDPERIYLTGLSMGGFGAWALATEYPTRFAAIVPICGGGESWAAPALKNIPTWAFHGDNDQVVPHARSEEMINALKRAGNQNAQLTTYPNVGHNAWTKTYANPKLYQWLLEFKKK